MTGNMHVLHHYSRVERDVSWITIVPFQCFQQHLNYWKGPYTQLCTFLTEHSLVSPYQCGFRKNHSTEAAAIALTDYIRLGRNRYSYTTETGHI